MESKMKPAELTELQQELATYVNKVTTLPEDISTLRNTLKSDHKYLRPNSLLSTTEMEIQHDLLQKMLGSIRQIEGRRFRFTNIQIAFFLLLPIDSLRSIADGPVGAMVALLRADELLNFFMRGKAPRKASKTTSKRQRTETQDEVQGNEEANEEAGGEAMDDSDDDGDDDSDGEYHPKLRPDGKLERDQQERKKCLQRDGQHCVITGIADPEVCHIIPFAVNDSEDNASECRDFSTYLYYLCGKSAETDVLTLLGRVGRSDKSWNMVSLDRCLHFWWGQGRIGLNCRGMNPVGDEKFTLNIQFHWLSPNNLIPRGYVTLNKESIEKMIKFSSTRDIGKRTATRFDSNRRLITGQLFDTPAMTLEDATKMKRMLDIQWAVVRLAAMSGAAGAVELLDDDDDDEYDVERVQAWLHSVKSSH